MPIARVSEDDGEMKQQHQGKRETKGKMEERKSGLGDCWKPIRIIIRMTPGGPILENKSSTTGACLLFIFYLFFWCIRGAIRRNFFYYLSFIG